MKTTVLNSHVKENTIVFLPGLFAGGWIWDRIINDFPEYKLVIFEDSIVEAVDAKKSFEQMANDMAGILKKLDLDRTALVGNSLGSLLAILICNQNQIKVKRVIISGCPGMNKNVNLGIGLPGIDGISIWLDKLADQLFYNKNDILSSDFAKDDLKSKLMKPFRDRFTFLKMVRIAKQLNSYSIKDTVKDFDVPSLGIWGDCDSVTPVEHWKDLPQQNKNFQLQVVEHCGHSPMIERPQEFSKALQTFMIAA